MKVIMEDKANSATYLMNYLSRVYYDKVKQRLQEEDISRIMFFNMIYIKKNPNVAMNALAREFNIDKSYITRIIAKLLEMDLVEKRTSERDSRVQLLKLSEKGDTVLNQIFIYLMKQEEGLRKQLTPDEYEFLIKILKKLHDLNTNKEIEKRF
ncbi:MAG: MarR family transcriptional regulator [Peptostreptococcaceae bacterium]|nr:MarR family transcriptional regulator [Peptostreptococcaceae bacterium]